jgi:hypothetical protein
LVYQSVTMKTIRSVLPNSVIMCNGTVSREQTLDKLQFIFDSNTSIFSLAKKVIVVINKNLDTTLEEFNSTIEQLRVPPNLTFLVDHINRGYQIGFIDQDITGFNYFWYNKISYDFIFKCCFDTLFSENFLDVEIDEECDVNYLPTISSLFLQPHRSPEEEIKNIAIWKQFMEKKEIDGSGLTYNFMVQPWFYIMKPTIRSVFPQWDTLVNKYTEWLLKVNGDLTRQKEQLFCGEIDIFQSLLSQLNNKVKANCLLTPPQFDTYVKMIQQFNFGDSTIKNVSISYLGITHFHFKDYNIVEI